MEILGLIWKLAQFKKKKGVQRLFEWLVEAFIKKDGQWKLELEMSDSPWLILMLMREF